MKIVWLKYFFFLVILLILLLNMACNRNRNEDNEEFNKITYHPSDKPIDSLVVVDHSQTATVKRKGIKRPRKLALIVAISKYPPENGWLPTHASNDIHLIKSALALQGFDTLHHVKVLQDEKASKAGIISAIEQELIQGSNPGDKVVFHFSGHGQQVFDNNGDELDQYDESLVPYDAPMFTTGDYRGESHLIDDQLNLLFNQLRKKLGSQGSLLVTLDACYSGTATRARKQGFYRGTNHKILPSEAKIIIPDTNDFDDSWNLIADNEDENLSPIIVLSASQSNQINHEIEIAPEVYVGSLSYALNQSLQNFPATSSYRALYNNIVYHITSNVPDQQPYAEGMLDYQIFTATPQASPHYFNLIDQLNEKTIIISGNLFSGIKKGDVVHLYPAHTSDTSTTKYFNKGKVVYSDFWQSKLLLQDPLSPGKLSDYWAMPSSTIKNECLVKISGNHQSISKLKTSLSRRTGIHVVENNHEVLLDIISLDKNSYQFTIQDEHHQEIIKKSFSSEEKIIEFVSNVIVKKIRNIGEINQLRKLQFEDPLLKMDFELLPVWVNKDPSGIPVFKDYRKKESDSNGMLQFNDQDYFKLKVVNKNDFPVYFSIFDIYANHEISQLYPVNAKSLKAYIINANQEMEIPYLYYTTEPYGIDYLKLVACDQPFIKMSSFAAEIPGFLEDLLPVRSGKENDPAVTAQKLSIKTITYETLKPGI